MRYSSGETREANPAHFCSLGADLAFAFASMTFRVRDLRRFRSLISETVESFIGDGGRRLYCTFEAGAAGEFSGGKSAYEVLGVPESSSFTEIKVSFRKLAKETHPDIVSSASPGDAAASQRFLQILAAYEILSDSEKRAYYDCYLLSQREIFKKHCGFSRTVSPYHSSLVMGKQRNVVEWLKWYRLAVDDILMESRVATGSGYFHKLENELYSAIRMAYYGPLIESMDLLPNCFEAEERSAYGTSEVLHLVSGRDLFGIVNLVDRVPALPYIFHEKLSPPDYSIACQVHQHGCRQSVVGANYVHPRDVDTCEKETEHASHSESETYKDLELHICGRVVAMANRNHKCRCSSLSTMDPEDHIHIFLVTDGAQGSDSTRSSGSVTLVGTITGLGTSSEEGSCSVYDRNGLKTHVIMKHRTLLVKHMHWYQVHGEACECRCSRARLPPSKFWLFEPRSTLHDIGGWYIETFGRKEKGKTIPSQRQWDGMIEHHEKRLHPAIYLLALAYRTLDLERAKRTQWRIRDLVEPHFFRIFRWWRRLL